MGFLQIDCYRTKGRTSELVKLIGCLQPGVPRKHPKNNDLLQFAIFCFNSLLIIKLEIFNITGIAISLS